MAGLGSRVLVGLVVIVALSSIGVPHAAAANDVSWVSGVGDDANPCSRTAPCKTFFRAHAVTNAGGEIRALDPGGFGAVTVTKSITIAGDGTIADILTGAGTIGVIIDAASTDVVRLRNISILSAGVGGSGISVIQAGQVHVENVSIDGSAAANPGIKMTPTLTATLFLHNVTVRNNLGTGMLVQSTGGTATVVATNSSFINNATGINAFDRSRVILADCFVSGNSVGVTAGGAPSATVDIDRTYIGTNGVGIRSTAGALIRLSDIDLFENTTGIDIVGGTVSSWPGLRNAGSPTPGSPNGPALLFQ